jgi:hypothetical protein
MMDNVLLMIVLAFISGFMLQGIMKNMCGRLVEGDIIVGDGSKDSNCFDDSQCNGSMLYCTNVFNGVGNGVCASGCSYTDTDACPDGQTCSLKTRKCVHQSSGEQLAGGIAHDAGGLVLKGMSLLS